MIFKIGPWSSVKLDFADLLFLGFILIPISIQHALSDQFTVAKWITFYLISITVSVVFIFSQKPIFLPKSKLVILSLISIIFFYLCSALFNNGNYENQFLDWLCFVLLAAFTLNCCKQKLEVTKKLFLYCSLGIIPVLMLGFLQFFKKNPLIDFFEAKFPASFFGSPNMTAEYLGGCIIILIFCRHFFFKSTKPYFKVAVIFLLIMSHIYLFILLNRAALMSVLITNIFLFKILKGNGSRRILLISCLSIACFYFFNQTIGLVSVSDESLPAGLSATKSNLISVTQKEKKLSIDMRVGRYWNTLGLIKDNFIFGIGPGNYEFEYYPYRNIYYNDPEFTEDLILRSPHNSYLELLAENGVLTTASIILFFIILIIQIRGGGGAAAVISDQTLALAIVIYFCSIGLTSFPLENAFPFYILSISFGILLSKISCTQYIFPKLVKKSLSICLFIIIIYLSSMYSISNFYEADMFSENSYSFSCDHFPSNWRACLKKSQVEFESGDYQMAEHTLQKILNKTPNNFVAMGDLAILYLVQDKMEQACTFLKKYDNFFNEKSRLHSRYLESCM